MKAVRDLDRKLMMQYLETVSNMECQVYTLNRAYWDLHNQSERLGHPTTFAKPVKPEEKLSLGNMLFEVFWSMLKKVLPIWIVGAFVISTMKMVKYQKMYSGLFDLVPSHIQSEVFVESLVLAFIIATLIALGLSVRAVANRRKEIEARNKDYGKKLAAYEAAVTADNLRVQKELEVKAVLCAQRDTVLTEYWSARNALDALYNTGIIEKEYRDFAAVTTFYSYFRKEYCDRLAGPNQAYDRYDQALKIGEIINKLDIIINKLDEIAKNQAYLAALLRDSNDTLGGIARGNQKMLETMEAVEENSSLTEYNTRCAAESSKVTAMLTLFNTLKQNKDE